MGNDADSRPSEAECSDEVGATLTEYALLAALIAVFAIVAMRFFGRRMSGQFSRVASRI